MSVDHRFPRRGLWGVVAGLGLLALAGCGGPDQHPVAGKLVYADTDQPVREVSRHNAEGGLAVRR